MRKLSIFVFAIFIFCIGFAVTGCAQIEAGTDAPEVNATKWFNADSVKISDLKDKLVVVEFWATWCPPCRASIPHLEQLHNEFKDKGVVIISLSNEAPSVIEAFMKKAKMSWIIGAGSTAGKDYGVQGIPHAYIVKDGKIAWHGHPMNGLDKAIKANLPKEEPKTESKTEATEETEADCGTKSSCSSCSGCDE